MTELHETAVDLVFTHAPILARYASSVWWLMLLAAPRSFRSLDAAHAAGGDHRRGARARRG